MRKVVVAVVFLVMVILATLAFVRFRGDAPDSPIITPATPRKGPTASAPIPKVKPPAATPGPTSVAKIKEAIPKECVELWEDLRDKDYEELQKTKDKLDLKRGVGCPVPEVLSDAHQAYLEVCMLVKPQLPPDAPKGMKIPKPTRTECLAAAGHYKMAINDFLTRDIPLDQIKDLPLLVDKLNAEFERDPIKAADVAEEILRRNPSTEPAARAALIGRFLDAKSDASEGKWAKAEEALERLKRLPNSNSPQVAEMEMGISVFKSHDTKDLAQQAQAVSDQFPDSGVGPYHKALANYYDKDLGKTRELLLEALKREPTNFRYMDTLGRVEFLMKDGNANKEEIVDPVFSNEAEFSFSRNYEDVK